jgi:hypothetical protein
VHKTFTNSFKRITPVLSLSLTYTSKIFQRIGTYGRTRYEIPYIPYTQADTFPGPSNFTAPVNKEMIQRGGKRTKREFKNGYNPNDQKSIVT